LSGTPLEVLRVFLRLGCTSFGGPVAHLGYFRDELVTRRRWLGEADYADLVALCQFLPGPASSQVAFALGLLRGNGLLGGFAAWVGFTLPSAILLTAAALGARGWSEPAAQGLFHGLKLVAVAVVAQAVLGMARSLTPDRARAGIALAAVMIVVFIPGAMAQIAAIAAGAAAGTLLCRGTAIPPRGRHGYPVTPGQGFAALALFAALLIAGPLSARGTGAQGVALFDAFYRSGALVFGGGHVVLPLLQEATVATGWVDKADFLTGYGLAQAVPGPLFTFAAYLGAAAMPAPNGLAGAAIALAGIFLPGMLLVYGALPFWTGLRRRPAVQAAMRGTNAAVVGILGAALYAPVAVNAISSPPDFALALAGFLLLTVCWAPPWIVVVSLAIAGLMLR
jgi:chromate transporter